MSISQRILVRQDARFFIKCADNKMQDHFKGETNRKIVLSHDDSLVGIIDNFTINLYSCSDFKKQYSFKLVSEDRGRAIEEENQRIEEMISKIQLNTSSNYERIMLKKKLEREYIQEIDISPDNQFLTSINKFQSQHQPNVFVRSIGSNKVLLSETQKNFNIENWPIFKWFGNSTIYGRSVGDRLVFYNTKKADSEDGKDCRSVEYKGDFSDQNDGKTKENSAEKSGEKIAEQSGEQSRKCDEDCPPDGGENFIENDIEKDKKELKSGKEWEQNPEKEKNDGKDHNSDKNDQNSDKKDESNDKAEALENHNGCVSLPEMVNWNVTKSSKHFSLRSFSFSPKGFRIAVFVKNLKNQSASQVAVYSFDNQKDPIKTMHLQAESVTFDWAKDGDALLVRSSLNTTKSYYMISKLILFTFSKNTELSNEKKVENTTEKTKENNRPNMNSEVQKDASYEIDLGKSSLMDCRFSNKGDRFIVISYHPIRPKVFRTRDCTILKEMAPFLCNTVVWSPNDRFAWIAGMINMAGNMSFWDMKTFEVLGYGSHKGARSFTWSSNSKFFITACLSPWRKVDNGYKIWSFCGKLMAEVKLDNLFQCSFFPSGALEKPFSPESLSAKDIEFLCNENAQKDKPSNSEFNLPIPHSLDRNKQKHSVQQKRGLKGNKMWEDLQKKDSPAASKPIEQKHIFGLPPNAQKGGKRDRKNDNKKDVKNEAQNAPKATFLKRDPQRNRTREVCHQSSRCLKKNTENITQKKESKESSENAPNNSAADALKATKSAARLKLQKSLKALSKSRKRAKKIEELNLEKREMDGAKSMRDAESKIYSEKINTEATIL